MGPIKILFVNNTASPRLFGGYELYMEQVIAALERDGDTVQVLSGVGPDALAWHNRYLSPLDDATLSARDATDAQTTRQVLKQFDPDLVSIWNLGGLSPVVFDTLTGEGCPYTLHVGDLWPAHALVPGDSRFDNVHYISRYVQSELKQANLIPRHSIVSHWGVEIDSQSRARTGTKLLFAGRICQQKGLHLIINALAHAPQFHLSIAGVVEDEAYWLKLCETIQRDGLAGRIDYLGPMTREQMHALYAAHDLLVYPSLHGEALGLSILEAMAAGLLVIASEVGGIREILEPGVNGLTFDPNDPEKLVHCLHRAQACGALSEAGRQTVADRFSFTRSVKDIRQFMNTVVDAHSHAEPTV